MKRNATLRMISLRGGLMTTLLVGNLACSSRALDGGSNDGGPRTDAGASDAPVSVGTSRFGESCDADHGCVDGLSCLDVAEFPVGQPCRVVGKQCTKPCAAGPGGEATCASLGPKHTCFAGCVENGFFCGATL